MLKGLEAKKRRFEELESLVADPKIIANNMEYQKLAKELSGLRPIVEKYNEYCKLSNSLEELDVVANQKGHDREFAHMVDEERHSIEEKIVLAESALDNLLFSKEEGLGRDIIMEIRAGTGGLEAGLFAADLYRMYTRFAAKKNWKVEAIDSNMTEKGGYKEIIFSISGKDVYGTLKYESGTHRVQRVPQTEASGRIHTSAATVAVLPEAEEVDIAIKPDDLKIDVFRAGGKGGQHVNKTESAVRITHLPTGLVVSCQDERSQYKNKEKAMRVLRARLYDMVKAEAAKKTSRDRKEQVGTGDRSEKIRTYNFPDRRITDHRIGFTIHNLENMLEGDLGELIAALKDADKKLRLQGVNP